MSKRISDAREAISIAKDYAKSSMPVVFWKDVVSCDFDEKMDEWRIVFEASPGLLAPYYKYEIVVDSNGNVKRTKKIEA